MQTIQEILGVKFEHLEDESSELPAVEQSFEQLKLGCFVDGVYLLLVDGIDFLFKLS